MGNTKLLLTGTNGGGLYPPKLNPLVYRANVSAADPGLLGTMVDSPSGISITRVSGTQDNSLPERHLYGSIPAWNADQTLLNLGLNSPNRKMRQGRLPFAVLQNDQGNTSTLWWYCTDPTKAWCVNGADNGIRRLNVTTAGAVSIGSTLAAATISASFAEVRPGGVQGGSDDTDTYIAFAWKDTTPVTANYGIGVLNLTTGAIHAQRTIGTLPAANAVSTVVDNCGMSHTGSWAWFTFATGNGVGAGTNQGMWMYERDLNTTTRRQASQSQQHCDWAMTAGGLDRFVWWNGNITSTDPNTGTNTVLQTPVLGGTYISGRNFLRKGWFYVSQLGDNSVPPASPPYTDPGGGHIFALSIDTPGLAEDWGSLHKTTGTTYMNEPHACASPDGTMVVASHQWESDGWIYDYVHRWR